MRQEDYRNINIDGSNKNIEIEMFEEIRKLFPKFDYTRQHYKEVWDTSSVDELIAFAYYQMSTSVSRSFVNYGWKFRLSDDPETEETFLELEQIEDDIYGEFIKFFDFYYTYKKHSSRYEKMNFKDYLALQIGS
ncbi:hypothetical protein [Lactococcus formosensis]|uniref:hypothetical protein n=1 Tax=Lactococcus formosensis TaxID=1281486 RepID=UPI00311B2685